MCLTLCLKIADIYPANFCNVDSSFGREENEKNLKCFNLFPNSKVLWPLIKALNTWVVHRQTRQMKKLINGSNLSLKTAESLTMNVLTCRECHCISQNILNDRWPETWNSRFSFPTMTAHLLTQLCLCESAWLKNSDSCFTSSVVTEFSVVWLTSIPKTQDSIEGREIEWYYHNQSKISRCPYHFSSSLLFEMLWIMVHILELLYKLPRRLLRNGQHCLQGKCYWYGAVSSQCAGQLWSRLLLLRTLILFG